MLIMSPSFNLRLSGIPWQITSLTDLGAWRGHGEERENELPVSMKLMGGTGDVRADGFRISPISQRGRIGIALDSRVVHDLVNLVRRHAWPDGGCGNIQHLARELQSAHNLSRKMDGASKK